MSCRFEECDPGSWSIILEFLLSNSIFRLKSTSSRICKKIRPKHIHWPSGWHKIRGVDSHESDHFIFDRENDVLCLLNNNQETKFTYYKYKSSRTQDWPMKYLHSEAKRPVTNIVVLQNQFIMMGAEYSFKNVQSYFVLDEHPKVQKFPFPKIANCENRLDRHVCFASFHNQVYAFFYVRESQRISYCSYKVSFEDWSFHLTQPDAILLPFHPGSSFSFGSTAYLKSVLMTERFLIFLFAEGEAEFLDWSWTILIYNRDTHEVTTLTRKYVEPSPRSGDELSLHYVSDRVFMIYLENHQWSLCTMKGQTFLVKEDLNRKMTISGNLNTQTCFSLVQTREDECFLQELR